MDLTVYALFDDFYIDDVDNKDYDNVDIRALIIRDMKRLWTSIAYPPPQQCCRRGMRGGTESIIILVMG